MGRGAVLCAALALAACQPGRPADEPAPPPPAAEQPGRLPERSYACRIWQPGYTGPMLETQEEDRAYGTLAVTGDDYVLRLEDGTELKGRYRMAADRSLTWEGDLGSIDDAPRRVVGSRFATYADVVNFSIDFAPPTEGPVPLSQVICRAEK